MLKNINDYESFVGFVKKYHRNIKDISYHPWSSTSCKIDRYYVLVDIDKGFGKIYHLDTFESTGHIYMSGKNLESISDWIRF